MTRPMTKNEKPTATLGFQRVYQRPLQFNVDYPLSVFQPERDRNKKLGSQEKIHYWAIGIDNISTLGHIDTL